ncbi:aldehyde dehydrogenase family protein [Peribacillus frigoritolerans]|nr:aldehyde dehydrogenase family protein [Peribacillus frigoritolerans]
MIVPGTPIKRISTIKQPVSVVAAITPWNCPLSMEPVSWVRHLR